MPNTDEYIGVVISDVARLLRTEFDRRVRRLGITRAQWLVLTRLHRRPGASHSELAEMMEVEKATAGRMIDRLVANGWVERRTQRRRPARQARLSDARKPNGCTSASGASPKQRSTPRSPISPRGRASSSSRLLQRVKKTLVSADDADGSARASRLSRRAQVGLRAANGRHNGRAAP